MVSFYSFLAGGLLGIALDGTQSVPFSQGAQHGIPLWLSVLLLSFVLRYSQDDVRCYRS